MPFNASSHSSGARGNEQQGVPVLHVVVAQGEALVEGDTAVREVEILWIQAEHVTDRLLDGADLVARVHEQLLLFLAGTDRGHEIERDALSTTTAGRLFRGYGLRRRGLFTNDGLWRFLYNRLFLGFPQVFIEVFWILSHFVVTSFVEQRLEKTATTSKVHVNGFFTYSRLDVAIRSNQTIFHF